MIEFEIKENVRLDKYIKALYKNLPFSKICKCIRKNQIKVNKKRAKYDQILGIGDIVTIYIDKHKILKKKKSIDNISLVKKITFGVVYEDKDILVINKPSGIDVHGNKKNKITLIDQVLKYLDYNETWDFKPYLAHRLDRDTSGVIIIAKTRLALEYFFDAFKKRKVKKDYIAIVYGKPKNNSGIINMPIEKIDKGIRKACISGSGKEAITEYKLLETKGIDKHIISKLILTPKTGKIHQIRLHLEYIGLPILGDRQYGDWGINKIFKETHNINRVMLHAYTIEFIHPILNKPVSFRVSIPKCFNII